MTDSKKDELILNLLEKENNLVWGGLEKKPVSKKAANKFLLACSIDYQMDADRVWANAWRLAEEILGDPENIWLEIAKISETEWARRFEQYKLHRFRKAHQRIWRIAGHMQTNFAGDARNLWSGKNAEQVLADLTAMQFGEQLSRMVVLALHQNQLITGSGTIKADLHTRKVLGRVYRGSSVSAKEAVDLAERILPGKSWELDQALFTIGKQICVSEKPLCTRCDLKRICSFYETQRKGRASQTSRT